MSIARAPLAVKGGNGFGREHVCGVRDTRRLSTAGRVSKPYAKKPACRQFSMHAAAPPRQL
jgi:hypothetical protein